MFSEVYFGWPLDTAFGLSQFHGHVSLPTPSRENVHKILGGREGERDNIKLSSSKMFKSLQMVTKVFRFCWYDEEQW